jgi:hypothetical protein
MAFEESRVFCQAEISHLMTGFRFANAGQAHSGMTLMYGVVIKEML